MSIPILLRNMSLATTSQKLLEENLDIYQESSDKGMEKAANSVFIR